MISVERIEQEILDVFSRKNREFLSNARRLTEGILKFILKKEDTDICSLQELRDLLEDRRLDDLVMWIQSYGNIAIHHSSIEITKAETVLPVKLAMYDLIHIFYEQYLETTVPVKLIGLFESDSNYHIYQSNSGLTKLKSAITNGFYLIFSDKQASWFKNTLRNVLNALYEFVFYAKEGGVPKSCLRGPTRIIDLNKCLDHFAARHYIDSETLIHFKALNSYALYKRAEETKEDATPINRVTRNNFQQVIHWFFDDFVKYTPDYVKIALHMKDEKKADKVMGWLLRDDQKQAMVFSLFEGKNIIGRYDADGLLYNQIIVNDSRISRSHAQITVSKKENGFPVFTLSDEKPSKNGTFLNGSDKRISETETIALKNEDVLFICKDLIKLRFRKNAGLQNILNINATAKLNDLN
jgi:pSer/pThr/pTyr-binding forkhead associated (FHA) protein